MDSSKETITLHPVASSEEAALAYTSSFDVPLISADLIPPQVKVVSVLLLISLAVPIFMQPNLVSAAKVIMIYVMVSFSAVALVIAFFRDWLFEKLVLVEDIADMVKEEASMQLQLVNHKLNELNYRYFEKKDSTARDVLPEFLRNLTPFAMLIINKEQSMMRWASVGMKFAKSAMELYQARKEQE